MASYGARSAALLERVHQMRRRPAQKNVGRIRLVR